MTTRSARLRIALLIAAAAAAPALRAQDLPPDVKNDLKAGLPEVRRKAIARAAELGRPDAVPFLLPVAAADKDARTRDAAFEALVDLRGKEAVALLVERGVGSRQAAEREVACEVLGAQKAKDLGDALAAPLADREVAVRRAAAAAACSTHPDACRAALLDRVERDADPLVRSLAIEAVSRLGDAGDLLARWLEDPREDVRLTALRQVRFHDKAAASRAAAAVLADPAAPVPLLLAAIEQAAIVRGREPLEALVALLAHPRSRVRDAAFAALRGVTALDIAPDPKLWADWFAQYGRDFAVPERAGAVPAAGSRSEARFFDLPIVSDRVAFVIDASGSMRDPFRGGKPKYEVARQALQDALARLPAGSRFTVLTFGTQPRAWKNGMIASDAAGIAAADQFLKSAAPGGTTNLFDALESALALPEIDTIVLLSDGAPSSGRFQSFARIRHHVNRLDRLRRVAISTVALVDDPGCRRFLAELAEDTGGERVEP